MVGNFFITNNEFVYSLSLHITQQFSQITTVKKKLQQVFTKGRSPRGESEASGDHGSFGLALHKIFSARSVKTMCCRLGNRPTKCTIAYQQMSRCSIDVVVFKQPTYGGAVCFFPHFNSFDLRQVLSLIEFRVASKAEARDSVIMALNSSAFTVSKLVTVRCNHSSIVSSTMLTGGLSKDFKQFLIPIH